MLVGGRRAVKTVNKVWKPLPAQLTRYSLPLLFVLRCPQRRVILLVASLILRT